MSAKTGLLSLALLLCAGLSAAPAAYVVPGQLLQDPSRGQWQDLARYSGTLTRGQFEARLHNVFDPFNGLAPFLQVTDSGVTVFANAAKSGTPLVTIRFAPSASAAKAPATGFRSPAAIHQRSLFGFSPLAGIRVAIEPADIGGAWGPMEDRSVFYHGYGLVQEGDLNLKVGRLLRDRLRQLGARAYLIRDADQPVSGLSVSSVEPVVPSVLATRSYIMPAAFQSRAGHVSKGSPAYRKIAAEVLLTKNLEALARAEKTRRNFQPDMTIVLQFDATPGSGRAALTPVNRNIFFVSGSYTAKELSKDATQRWRLMTKLLQNVTPVETTVAVQIANRFRAATGYPAVLYGNSATTRVVANTPFVVARNLAFNRQHDGPVVVTEPYFMNQPVTLKRLLAGDYSGTRVVAGAPRISIYREYANTVAQGLADAYGR